MKDDVCPMHLCTCKLCVLFLVENRSSHPLYDSNALKTILIDWSLKQSRLEKQDSGHQALKQEKFVFVEFDACELVPPSILE